MRSGSVGMAISRSRNGLTDDAYLGGERPGTRGRGSPNKVPFVIAVDTRDGNKPHQVAIRCMPFTKDAVSLWANTALHADTHALSDGLPAFRALADEVAVHQPIITGSGRAAATHPEFRCVNIVLGNLKTAITGTYHAFKFTKYAPRYLAEFQYRFNRRYNLRSILPRLLRAAAITRPWAEPSSGWLSFRTNQVTFGGWRQPMISIRSPRICGAGIQ